MHLVYLHYRFFYLLHLHLQEWVSNINEEIALSFPLGHREAGDGEDSDEQEEYEEPDENKTVFFTDPERETHLSTRHSDRMDSIKFSGPQYSSKGEISKEYIEKQKSKPLADYKPPPPPRPGRSSQSSQAPPAPLPKPRGKVSVSSQNESYAKNVTADVSVLNANATMADFSGYVVTPKKVTQKPIESKLVRISSTSILHIY